jgi:hypothetical protein
VSGHLADLRRAFGPAEPTGGDNHASSTPGLAGSLCPRIARATPRSLAAEVIFDCSSP